jgi:Rps23 Pro-64 3,4-dihydroxylase Tpa1-like proline 4-hydroxylase
MPDTYFDLDSIKVESEPFPHFSIGAVLPSATIVQLFDWFQQTDLWNLVETDFYEQYEFSLLHSELPIHLQFLVSQATIRYIELKFVQEFAATQLKLVDVVAHKLVNKQHIGVHNDFIDHEETHRMVLHVNPLWKEENGGLLLLFNSSKVEDLSKIVKPLDNTAFGFEISRQSHHAVSKIYDYTRYTIVYTFKQV